nr:MAG TPA: hypothetical protein [Caudoviricetes sp.]
MDTDAIFSFLLDFSACICYNKIVSQGDGFLHPCEFPQSASFLNGADFCVHDIVYSKHGKSKRVFE